MDPYGTGVLNEEHHARLVQQIDEVAEDAGLQKSFIWTRLGDICGEDEVSWVTRFRKHSDEGYAGFCYSGAADKGRPVEDRMAAIAGALTRNFIRARVMTAQQVAQSLRDSQPVTCSALLIPNFFVSKASGGSLAPWQVSLVSDLLISRWTAGLQTVVYCSNMNALRTEYGDFVARHIESHYHMAGLA